MPIPKTREELVTGIERRYRALSKELDTGPTDLPDRLYMDDWTVKDVLATRRWWAERVVDWIEAGECGDAPVTPAPGYGWNQTPALNARIVSDARAEPYASVRSGLDAAKARVLATVDRLSDAALFTQAALPGPGSGPSPAGYPSPPKLSGTRHEKPSEELPRADPRGGAGETGPAGRSRRRYFKQSRKS
ncbi:MAG: ClbS/DfsB family four-helix bundle protein [Pseudomonadota bacterium]